MSVSLRSTDAEIADFSKLLASPKKRKEYHRMYDIDDFLMPYKAIKSNPSSNFLDVECESIWIEDKSNEQVPHEDVDFRMLWD